MPLMNSRPQPNRPAEITNQPTAFEVKVQKLHLRPEEYASSPELKAWVEENKDQRYVPSELLKTWGMRIRAEV